MFGDFGWLPFRTDEQMRRFEAWLDAVRGVEPDVPDDEPPPLDSH